MNIGQRLSFGLAGIVCLLGMAGIFGLIASGQIIDSYGHLKPERGPIEMSTAQVRDSVNQAHDHLARFLLFSHAEDRAAIQTSLEAAWAAVGDLGGHDLDNEYTGRLGRLSTALSSFEEGTQAALNAVDQHLPRLKQQELLRALHPIVEQMLEQTEVLAGRSLEFLGRRETMALAQAVEQVVSEADLYLNSYLLAPGREDKVSLLNRVQQAVHLAERLSADSLDAKTQELVRSINKEAAKLPDYALYLVESTTQDLAIQGTIDASAYTTSLKAFYETVAHVKREAEALQQQQRQLLQSEQASEVSKATAIQYSILLVITLAVIGSVILSLRMTRSIARPIEKLQRAVDLYGRGKFDREIDIESDDEIGSLARSFNRMIDNLRESMVSKSFVVDIIESMPETLVVLHPDLRIKMVNRATLNLLGYEEQELVGRHVSMLFAPASELKSATPELFCERTSTAGREELFMTKARREITVLFSVSPISGENAQLLELVCSAKDITPIKQANSQLRQSLKKLSDVMFALDQSGILLIMDDRGTITHANDQYCALCGFSRDELIGRLNGLERHPAEDPEILDSVWETIGSGQVWRGDLLRQHKGGGDYWLRATIVPFLDESNTPFQYLAICFDITNRIMVEQELIEAKASAEASNQAKSAFLAKMSHELRTPLNAILGYCELLQEEFREEKQDHYSGDLHKIHSAGSHLLALINDILDLSKVEAGKTDLYLERFMVKQLIDEVVSTVRPLTQKNNNVLTVEVSEDLEEMTSDMVKVKQVLLNLLSNACKFTENGEISLIARQVEKHDVAFLSIAVTDTGTGIPADKLESIFEAFTQADSSTTRKYGGTGLGLAISNKFAGMMGGEVRVDSCLEEGSTFTFELPLELSQHEAKTVGPA